MERNKTARTVKAQIQKSGKSNRWVAEKTLIPATTFHRKVEGKVDFHVDEVGLIAMALNVEPCELLPDFFQCKCKAAQAA